MSSRQGRGNPLKTLQVTRYGNPCSAARRADGSETFGIPDRGSDASSPVTRPRPSTASTGTARACGNSTGRRLRPVDEVPRRAAVPGDDGRLPGVRGRERGGHHRNPTGHGSGGAGRQARRGPADYAPATAAGAGRHRRHAPAGAVVVECVQDGGRLRVHVVSEGYDSSWNVQFPCTVRSPGHATSWTPCTRRPAASTASPVTSGDCCDQGVRSKGQPAAARSIRSAAVRSPSRARMVSEALARVSRSSVSPSNAARAPCSSSSVNRYGSSRTP